MSSPELLDDLKGQVHQGFGVRVAGDLRVLLYLSAILRELCVRPLRSDCLAVVRSRAFYETMESMLGLALKWLRLDLGDPNRPRNICADGDQERGTNASPLSRCSQHISLALVFEHLLVCLRHLLVQAMFLRTHSADLPSEPWSLHGQEQVVMRLDPLAWLPKVVRQFIDETIRCPTNNKTKMLR